MSHAPTKAELEAALALIAAAEAAEAQESVSSEDASPLPTEDPSVSETTTQPADVSTAQVASLPPSAVAPVEHDETTAAPDLPTTKIHAPHQVQLKGFLGPVWQKF